ASWRSLRGRRRRGGRRHDRLRDSDRARVSLSPDLPRSSRNKSAGMIGFLASIGALFIAFLAALGRIASFAVQALAAAVTPPFFPRLILRQIVDIGYFSLPVVGLTAIFTGMVLALQSYTGFSRFNAESAAALPVSARRRPMRWSRPRS